MSNNRPHRAIGPRVSILFLGVRCLLNCIGSLSVSLNGGTMIGPSFSPGGVIPYSAYSHTHTQPMLGPMNTSRCQSVQPPTIAPPNFFQPIVYWPYPSSPVSPPHQPPTLVIMQSPPPPPPPPYSMHHDVANFLHSMSDWGMDYMAPNSQLNGPPMNFGPMGIHPAVAWESWYKRRTLLLFERKFQNNCHKHTVKSIGILILMLSWSFFSFYCEFNVHFFFPKASRFDKFGRVCKTLLIFAKCLSARSLSSRLKWNLGFSLQNC